jgi:serine/threonine-protein kinase
MGKDVMAMNGKKDHAEQVKSERAGHIENLKGDEAKVRQVRSEVELAVQTMRERHAGADLAESRKLLKQVSEAINKGDTGQAISLAQKAQLAAKPNTEYLLDRAKKLEASGSEAYKKQKYSEAIELWRRSVEGYDKAKETAVERKEEEIVKALASTTASIKRDMEVARREDGNTQMLAIVADANKAADEAKQSFNVSDFDGAKLGFESARDLYARAVKVAGEFGFEDKDRIAHAEGEMRTSIEACLLRKGETLIKSACEEKGANRGERAFLQVVSYLETLSSLVSERQTYDGLRTRAYQGVAQARIEIGMQLMGEAEALFNKKEFYQAKEAYRKVQQHFESVSDFAVEHRLERERNRADELKVDCAVNASASATAMVGRDEVAKGTLRKVVDLREGIRLTPEIQHAAEETLGKLEKEYASVRHVASGGFGDVYVARTKEGKTIALKVLREPAKNESVFFRELTIWQSLVHRNIVRLLSPKIHPLPLFEMEYVSGGNLSRLMRNKGRLSPERAGRIAFDIASGLEHAHKNNVIHADLKPHNILLTEIEEAKITDWGLGKIASSSSRGSGYSHGYGAPEQILKKPLDKRTDTFQLGVVFYEMLTGTNPFICGSVEEEDDRVLKHAPDKPSGFDGDLEPLDDLVQSCVEKESGDRPTMHEFREALSKYVKERYGLLLHVTENGTTKIQLLSEAVFWRAKQSDYTGCLQALRDLRACIAGSEAKKAVDGLVGAMEYRQRDRQEITDGVLDEVSAMLRQIEHGQS